MSSLRRTLLFSGTVPGEPGVGGIILSDLYETLDSKLMPCFSVIRRGDAVRKSAQTCRFVCGWEERRYETGYRPLRGICGEIVGRQAGKVLLGRQCRRVIESVVKTAQALKVDQVWAILDSPTVILTARKVAERLGVPLIVLVWDAPELLCTQCNLDRWSTAEMMSEFDAILRSAVRIAVVGETMQARYSAKYHRPCIVVRHGVDCSLWRSACVPRQADESSRTLVIGYAGSITATDAFTALIRMLDQNRWMLDGKQVVLRMAGTRYLLEPVAAQRIDYFGWRSVAETIDMLATADVLYLPQPFSESLRPLAELSFPTKLSTYLAAGKPILMHGPDYASVKPFFDRYPFGEWCSAMEPSQIAAALLKCADQSGRSAEPISRAREEELNAEVFRSRFLEFLNGCVPDSQDPDFSNDAVAAGHS